MKSLGSILKFIKRSYGETWLDLLMLWKLLWKQSTLFNPVRLITGSFKISSQKVIHNITTFFIYVKHVSWAEDRF